MDIKSVLIKCKKGDKKAFAELFKAYGYLIERTASKILTNKEYVKDVCQNVYIKVYQKIKDFNNHKSIKSWIYTIAFNESINYRNQIKLINTDIYGSDYFDAIPDKKENPLNNLINIEQNNLIKNTIEYLPSHYKSVIMLFYFNKMEPKNISQISNIPINTFYSRLNKARKIIKKIINEKMAAAV